MAISMRGLRVKPSYEQLIGVAVSDDLQHIKFPNRDASFLKKWFCIKSIRWRRYEVDGEATGNGIQRSL